MGERLREVRAADGRTLGVAQWGDLQGSVIFSLHGTPGSRLGRHPGEEALRRIGARVVTYDRSGYGASDRQPGRRIVDCVLDVGAIAGALGIERFAVTGGSGGGPHALAVAARLPERVVRAECLVGAAPPDAAGLDWFAGMDPENVREFGWARQGERVLHRELERQAAEDLERIGADPSKLLSDDWQLDTADRHVLARDDVQRVMGEMVREAYRRPASGDGSTTIWPRSSRGASTSPRSACRSSCGTGRRTSSYRRRTAPGSPRTCRTPRSSSTTRWAIWSTPTPGCHASRISSRHTEPVATPQAVEFKLEIENMPAC